LRAAQICSKKRSAIYSKINCLPSFLTRQRGSKKKSAQKRAARSVRVEGHHARLAIQIRLLSQLRDAANSIPQNYPKLPRFFAAPIHNDRPANEL